MTIRPFTFEFTGPPYSGKTTLITGLADELTKMGYKVKIMQDDSKIAPNYIPKRTWNHNFWITCAKMQSLLEIPYLDVDIVLLDRGLYDALFWSKFLCSQNLCTQKQSDTLYRYLQEMKFQFNLEPNGVFFIDVSAEESFYRKEKLGNNNVSQADFSISSYRKKLENFYKSIKTNRCLIDTTYLSISNVNETALSYICHVIDILKYTEKAET